MRLFVGLTICLLLVTAGCSPPVPTEDLGTIQGDVSEVPGANEPYELPQVEPSAEVQPEIETEAESEVDESDEFDESDTANQ